MRNCFLIILCLTTEILFSQVATEIEGKYVPEYKDYKTSSFLKINSDSSFEFQWHHSLGSCYADGKWRLDADTLILDKRFSKYECDAAKSFSDDRLKDSLVIKFSNCKLAKEVKVNLNGDCHKSYFAENGTLKIKKERVDFILVNGDQKFIFRNRSDNVFLIEREIVSSHIWPNFINRERWIFKNGAVYELNCSEMTDVKYVKAD